MITVQPLKQSEMQPSYAQDMGTDIVSPTYISLYFIDTETFHRSIMDSTER